MAHILFHLAFPVTDLAVAKEFYAEGLGCGVGRESASALILDLGGNQIVAHKTADPLAPQAGIYPRHFGLIFSTEAEWEAMRDRAMEKGLNFFQPPRTRYEGDVLEHRTFFLADPFHNLLEFKFYRHPEAVFGAVGHDRVGDR